MAGYHLSNFTDNHFNIPRNVNEHKIDLVNGVVPKRVFLMLQRGDRFLGTIATTPYRFERFHLKEVKTDGEGGWDKLELEGAKHKFDAYKRFIRMRQVSNQRHQVTYAEFVKDYNMLVFDFTPDDDFTDSVKYPARRGKQNFILRFSTAPTADYKAIFIKEFDSLLELDMKGSVNFTEIV